MNRITRLVWVWLRGIRRLKMGLDYTCLLCQALCKLYKLGEGRWPSTFANFLCLRNQFASKLNKLDDISREADGDKCFEHAGTKTVASTQA